jgi:hypothetical protein
MIEGKRERDKRQKGEREGKDGGERRRERSRGEMVKHRGRHRRRDREEKTEGEIQESNYQR